MVASKKYHFSKIDFRKFVLFSALIFSGLGFSQEREVKTDSLQINDSITGVVKYAYDESVGDEVYDGEFNFQSVSKSKQKGFDFEAITYEGEYTSDKKSGDWSYSDKKMKELDQKFVTDFRIGNLASGTENKVSGQFKEGKAVGSWRAVKQDYISSEVEDTLFLIESNFKENQLTGSIKSKSELIVVQGYFNADGYFHGDWEIEHLDGDQPVKETRTYEAGILKEYTITIDDTRFDLSYTGLDTTLSVDDEEWEDYSLNDGYFDILSLVDLEVEQSISSSVKVSLSDFHKRSNEFIKNSILAFSFNSGFDIWNGLRGSEELGLGKFQVRKFEYTSEEEEKVKEIASSFKEIKSLLKDFSENSKVKLGKTVYEKFNEVELVFNVYRNEIDQLENMVDVITSEAFEYIDRDDIYKKIWPKLQFPVEVTYEFQSELVSKSHEFPEPPSREDFDLESAHQLIIDIQKDVEGLDEEVGEIFKAMEIEKSLSEDEEKLVKRKDKIEDLFRDTDKESYNSYHDRYVDLVLELAETSFNDYGNLEVEDKKDNIKSLLGCYDDLLDFYEFLENLKKKDERLDDAFTKTSFNAFMMVDMSERIKENIYKAFDDTLKPYLLERLSDNFSCDNLDSAMESINEVYKKMLDLSNRDTKEEERELKRQRDPEAILSVLELDLKY